MTDKTKVNQVILLILDDVRSSHLIELMQQGKTPNLSSLADGGIVCKKCITSFPSVTFPCYSNILIGAYSGYYPEEGSGIPGYHWISRTDPPSKGKKLPIIRNYSNRSHMFKIGKDLGKNVKTIFEQAGDGNFLSMVNVIFRGSKFSTPSKFNSSNIVSDISHAFEKPGDFFQNKEVPRITVGYIPQTDALMHDKGFDHEDYISEIIKIDKRIGILVESLKDFGYYDSTAICVTSDHGNYRARNFHDVEPYFNDIGLVPYDPKKGKGDFDLAMGSVGTFNFRGKNWNYHPSLRDLKNYQLMSGKTIDIFEVIWNLPGIKFVYYPDDENTPEKGTIHIEARNEKSGPIKNAKIHYRSSGRAMKTKYEYNEHECFGYEKSENATQLLDGEFHTIEEWLEGTYDVDFPILIDQLPRYFKNPRSCDVMASTVGDYIYNYEHGKTANDHLYSHDIGLKKSMHVPLIIGGSPDLPQKELTFAKTTDVVPTLLRLLGMNPDKSVVGKSLIT